MDHNNELIVRVIYRLSNQAIIAVVNAYDGSSYYNELTCDEITGIPQDVLAAVIARGMDITAVEEFLNTHTNEGVSN